MTLGLTQFTFYKIPTKFDADKMGLQKAPKVILPSPKACSFF